MNTAYLSRGLSTFKEQTLINSTSWIGFLHPDNDEIIKGQTFEATSDGSLDDVQIFSDIVTGPCDVVMTLHNYDPQHDTWSNPIASSTLPLKTADTGHWVSFPLAGMNLQKGCSYGFRISSRQRLIGLGEAAGTSNNPPVINGQEWRFKNGEGFGERFSFFALAYKLGLRA